MPASIQPQDTTQPTSSPEEEEKSYIEERKAKTPRVHVAEEEDPYDYSQSLTHFAKETQLP